MLWRLEKTNTVLTVKVSGHHDKVIGITGR